jgi:hypothetical protein
MKGIRCNTLFFLLSHCQSKSLLSTSCEHKYSVHCFCFYVQQQVILYIMWQITLFFFFFDINNWLRTLHIFLNITLSFLIYHVYVFFWKLNKPLLLSQRLNLCLRHYYKWISTFCKCCLDLQIIVPLSKPVYFLGVFLLWIRCGSEWASSPCYWMSSIFPAQVWPSN